MKQIITILLFLICFHVFSQQHVFIASPPNTLTSNGNIYSLNLSNCKSHLVGMSNIRVFYDIARTPDGKLWGINGYLYQIDTTNALATTVGYSKGTAGVSLVALDDTTLIGEWYDSLEAINVKTAQSIYIGKVGYTADGDMSWYGNDLYMCGENQTYRGLIIKIEFNDTYTEIVKSTPININNPTPEFLGLATIFLNGAETLVGFNGGDTIYTISTIDGTTQFLCSSMPAAFGAASISYPHSLPIHLLNFAYSLINNSVKLQWQTAQEVNSNSFMVERSNDVINYSGIGEVQAAGNSNSIKLYSFIDNSPEDKNYYRLKEVDKDGKATYSNVLFVKLSLQQSFVILQNPVQNILKLQNKQSGYYSMYDFTGRRIKTGSTQTGNQSINITLLSSGIYVLQMITSNGIISSKVFEKK